MPLSNTIKHPLTGIPYDSLRYRLRMQGFTDVSDRDLHDVQLWLRLSPAVCMVGVALGTALASPVIIGILMPISALGAIYPYNLFDLIYNHGIRRVTGSAPLPRRRAPSRFACLVATIWLGLILWAFLAGAVVIGYILGGAMVFVAGLMTFMHYCIASHLYRMVLGWD
jgi:hypothetical protein